MNAPSAAPRLPALERLAVRLARWLDASGEAPAVTRYLGWAMRRLGVRSLREGQLEVILAALRRESVLMVSPTGSGKTLCFQVPTLLTPGMALSLIHISEPTRLLSISYAVFCLKKKNSQTCSS